MTQATDTDIRELRSAIADLSNEMRTSFSSVRADMQTLDARVTGVRADMQTLDTRITDIREEMRVGFAEIRGEIKEVSGKIDTSEAKLTGKFDKLEERTRLGFWGFVGRGLVLAILIALIPFVTKYAALFVPEILKP